MSDDRLRDRARQRAERYGRAGSRHRRRAWKGLVYLITSDKILQAILTGSVTGFVLSTNEAVAAYVQLLLRPVVPFYVPVKLYAAVGTLVLLPMAYYVDRNTDKWRESVRNVTGEDVSEDTATDEDVTGEQKD